MIIRKITVGNDYKNGMAYVVGQKVLKDCNIHHIKHNNHGNIDIYIVNKDKETTIWKTLTVGMPIVIEYDMDKFLEE